MNVVDNLIRNPTQFESTQSEFVRESYGRNSRCLFFGRSCHSAQGHIDMLFFPSPEHIDMLLFTAQNWVRNISIFWGKHGGGISICNGLLSENSWGDIDMVHGEGYGGDIDRQLKGSFGDLFKFSSSLFFSPHTHIITPSRSLLSLPPLSISNFSPLYLSHRKELKKMVFTNVDHLFVLYASTVSDSSPEHFGGLGFSWSSD